MKQPNKQSYKLTFSGIGAKQLGDLSKDIAEALDLDLKGINIYVERMEDE